MVFNSKKFWVAQALEVILTAAMFLGYIDFDSWWAKSLMIEGAWGGLDVLDKFAKKKPEAITPKPEGE